MLPALIAGAAAGSIVGGLISADAQRDSARMMAGVEREKLKYMQDAYNELSPYYKSLVEQMDPTQALAALQQWSPTPVPEAFAYDKTVQDFLDPSIAYQQQQATRQLQAGQAAAGDLQSGKAQKELQSRAMDIGSLGYNIAFDQRTTDKNFAYQDYTNQFGYARQANNDRLNQLTTLYNAGTNNLSNLSNLRLGMASQQANLMGSAGAYQAQANGMMGNALGQGIQQAFSPQNIGAAYNAFQSLSGPAAQSGGAWTEIANPAGTVGPGSTPYFDPAYANPTGQSMVVGGS